MNERGTYSVTTGPTGVFRCRPRNYIKLQNDDDDVNDEKKYQKRAGKTK